MKNKIKITAVGVFMFAMAYVSVWMILDGCSRYNAQIDSELQQLKDSLSQVINSQIEDVIVKDSIIIQYIEKPIPIGKKLVNENEWNNMVANCAAISAELEKILKDNNYQSLDIEKYLAKIKELKIDLRSLTVQDSLDNIKPIVTIQTTPKWNWITTFGVIGFVVICLALLVLFKKLKK